MLTVGLASAWGLGFDVGVIALAVVLRGLAIAAATGGGNMGRVAVVFWVAGVLSLSLAVACAIEDLVVLAGLLCLSVFDSEAMLMSVVVSGALLLCCKRFSGDADTGGMVTVLLSVQLR